MSNHLLETSFKRSEDVVFRKVSEEFIIVPVRKSAVDLGSIFSFNKTAARIWELLDGKRNGLEIVRIIASEFGVDDDEGIRSDYRGFIGDLQELGLVV